MRCREFGGTRECGELDKIVIDLGTAVFLYLFIRKLKRFPPNYEADSPVLLLVLTTCKNIR
jgi:hypothetical protein